MRFPPRISQVGFGSPVRSRIDQSRHVVTTLLVADARIISGIVRLYLLRRGRLASRFNDEKAEKRNIRHERHTSGPLERVILSFLKTPSTHPICVRVCMCVFRGIMDFISSGHVAFPRLRKLSPDRRRKRDCTLGKYVS